MATVHGMRELIHLKEFDLCTDYNFYKDNTCTKGTNEVDTRTLINYTRPLKGKLKSYDSFTGVLTNVQFDSPLKQSIESLVSII